jgi:hypothetical protein
MLDLITFKGAAEVKERSAMVITVAFRDQAALAKVTPTNLFYRLDDDGSGLVLLDWTAATPPVLPVNSVALTITAQQNRIVNDARELERKTISVMTDRGLATQFVGSYTYAVRNLAWIS